MRQNACFKFISLLGKTVFSSLLSYQFMGLDYFKKFLCGYINRKNEAERCIMMAAKIISPAIEGTFAAGYDWSV